MKIELVSIGDELLIGQTINTNASWIGEELAKKGLLVHFSSTIMDLEVDILQALEDGLNRSDVVILTGGLGPTKDDITKKTLCKYFKTNLVINDVVLQRVHSFFESRGKKMLDVNVQQAALPESAIVLNNLVGTASGMWFEKDGKVVISLPGVPYEMKHILLNEGFPRLFKRFSVSEMYAKTIYLQGIGEAFLADKFKDLESSLFSKGIKLAYLPSTGMVRLRFNGEKSKEVIQEINQSIQYIKKEIPVHFYSEGNKSLSEIVGEELVKKNATLATIESCTGGAIASEIVRIPGSSMYFQGSVVSYNEMVKKELVHVDQKIIDEFGVVSEEVAEEMARRGRGLLGVDFCISTTGIAGPDSDGVNKVGLIWIGIATNKRTFAKCFHFGNNRERNIQSAVLTALNLLRCELFEINS